MEASLGPADVPRRLRSLALPSTDISERLGSSVTAGEGAQNMLCARMQPAFLAALLPNATLGR
jgi:hypothetical protein